MLEVLIALALLIVIVGFMVHDRRTPDAASMRKLLDKGYTPGESLRWSLPGLASIVCALVAVLALLETGAPGQPAGWRSKTLAILLQSTLGAATLPIVALALAVIFAAIAIGQWRRRNDRR
ncbi:hypothetical protein [uncultured Ramlibacter sp.]|uniref:hypothetical protein n=1 Tax=uncultured Ramlibacter sp. TaxID=260755 RepID=UPI002631A7C7|nr:hypothetical protein [uncultured Ramlibacter sp.]